MAHPFNEHRSHHHQRDRVSHIAGIHEEHRMHRARGGHVMHDDEAEDRALIKKEVKGSALKHDGAKAKHRADKAPRRARGGHVKAKGHKGSKTNVNVIVAPGGGKGPMGGMMPPPAPPAVAGPPPMPPKPPMGAMPPGGAPAGPPPGMGGGMPIRRRGGRVSDTDDVMRHHHKVGKLEVSAHKGRHKKGTSTLHGHHHRADGGQVPMPKPRPPGREPQPSDIYSPADNRRLEQQRHMGGKVHDDWGASDMKPARNTTHGDLYGDSQMRGYKSGGAVEGKKSLADKRGVTGIGERTPIQHSGNKSDTQNIGRGPVITRATGGPIYADGREGHDMGPHIGAGNSGVGRLRKNSLARREHWEA